MHAHSERGTTVGDGERSAMTFSHRSATPTDDAVAGRPCNEARRSNPAAVLYASQLLPGGGNISYRLPESVPGVALPSVVVERLE